MANLENANTGGRNAARAAAQGAGQAEGSGKRRPAPRQDSGSVDGGDGGQAADPNVGSTGGEAAAGQTQTVASNEPAPIPLIVIAPNPKRAGTIAYGFYQKYGAPLQLTTFKDVMAAGVRSKDVSWDRMRRHILTHKEATDFPLQVPEGTDIPEGETEASVLRKMQADYLRGLPATSEGFSIDDKKLIAWGFMDAPAPVVEAAKEAVKTEEAASGGDQAAPAKETEAA